MSVRPSVCLSVCLSVCPFVCLRQVHCFLLATARTAAVVAVSGESSPPWLRLLHYQHFWRFKDRANATITFPTVAAMATTKLCVCRTCALRIATGVDRLSLTAAVYNLIFPTLCTASTAAAASSINFLIGLCKLSFWEYTNACRFVETTATAAAGTVDARGSVPPYNALCLPLLGSSAPQI